MVHVLFLRVGCMFYCLNSYFKATFLLGLKFKQNFVTKVIKMEFKSQTDEGE